MGFIFDPAQRHQAQDKLAAIMLATKRDLSSGPPFAMDPVVYDFGINEKGTVVSRLAGDEALLPDGYYNLMISSTRRIEDHGGGLTSADGRTRLIQGMALPSEDTEFKLTYYNSNTFWIDIDALLRAFELNRDDLFSEARTIAAIRDLAARMPT